jgi:hypothetical protein
MNERRTIKKRRRNLTTPRCERLMIKFKVKIINRLNITTKTAFN